MAFNDISLTSGMRNNLVSLQSTVSLLNRTQERLSSGKKVNSALDNPTSFFAAQSLNGRASDLSALKDGMGQGIQTIKSANNGISSISTLIDAAKGLAQTSLATTDTAALTTLQAQYTELMTQIDTVVTDSNYVGSNLLDGNATGLVVNFNEDNSSSLTIASVASDSGTLGTAGGGTAINAQDIGTDAATTNLAIVALNAAKGELRTTSAGLSAGLSIISARQDFTTQMVNTLSAGADNLTLADMNEEGANMLMLQTRQSLGTTALSLSAQAAQSVLKLF
jgi:flagellin-like hook-associated protein FlgL